MEKEAQELAGERLKGHESDRIGTKETISELKKKVNYTRFECNLTSFPLVSSVVLAAGKSCAYWSQG